LTERSIYLEDIPLEEARVRLENALKDAGRWQPLEGETVRLTDALRRVTARPIWAKLSSPHYHAAAMDGYAVRAEETIGATETQPLTLRIDQQAFAVNTGDPLPPETNAVIMIEDVQPTAPDQIEIRAAAAPDQHVRLMGEDIVATELVLPVNHTIRPADLGALAGGGHADVRVRKKPYVAIIPTGSELVPATQTPAPGQIIEYNSLMLRAQVIESGGFAHVTTIVPDQLDALRFALEKALNEKPDLILVLSGSSAGSKDFTASLIREMGTLLVHGIAVRPGHPVIIGMIQDIPVIGVPGYPVSAALTGELLIQPLLAHWLGKPAQRKTRVQAIMTRKLMSPTGDDDFVRVTLARVGERLLATPLSRGAGVITSLVRADGLAHIPRFSEGLDIGQSVEVALYQPVEVIENTALCMGSHDPMLDLLGQFLAARFPGCRLTSANVGSMGGLVALRRDEAHLAGIHLLDTRTGEYNLSYIADYLPETPLRLVTFAHREQGFMLAKGNPLNIQTFDDLPRVRYVNRQRGAGTRVLLDYELQKRGIMPMNIAGYEREENTHMAVAAAVASGVADCGMGVRSAAVALNLDFVPVGWERYDLAIPEKYAAHPGVQGILALLNDDEFREALGEQPGYDVRETGKVQYINPTP
jgi:molybdopterin molybdotransferase/putative molybdopterin biosynthesis protein